MRKRCCLLLCLLPFLAPAQTLRGFKFSTTNKLEITGVDASGTNMALKLPLFSLELNRKLYRTNEADFLSNILNRTLAITVANEQLDDGVKISFEIKNVSKQPLSISNLVPFGTNSNYTYITGKAFADSTRSFLFRPKFSPVEVIVPHNNNDLNFCTLPLKESLSLYGLIRRANDSIQNYLLIRTPHELPPGKSIHFYFYSGLSTGDWHAALKKCFQEKMLYEVKDFDHTLYRRKDLAWIRNA